MSETRRRAAGLVASLVLAVAGLFALAATARAAPCAYSKCTSISVSTTNPAVGATITVSGNGFGANDLLNITMHGKHYFLGTVTTNSSGSFSTSVTLPAGVSGHQLLTVVDADQPNVRASVMLIIGATGAPSGGTSSGGAGLSSTGVAVIGIGALGVILLLGGGVMLFAGRRRRVAA